MSGYYFKKSANWRDLYHHLCDDTDFISVFDEHNTDGVLNFQEQLSETLEYCYSGCEDNTIWMLDKKYLDYSWFSTGKVIFDLDGIYDAFRSQLEGK